MAINAENISIWWRHHVNTFCMRRHWHPYCFVPCWIVNHWFCNILPFSNMFVICSYWTHITSTSIPHDKNNHVCCKHILGYAYKILPAYGTQILTRCGLLIPYGGKDLNHFGPDNSLLSDSSKTLSEPVLTYHQWGPLTLTSAQFHKRYPSHLLLNLTSKLLF